MSDVMEFIERLNQNAEYSVEPASLPDFVVKDVLEHYGKKGMKWGSRSSRPPMKTSTEHKKVSEIKKKKTPQLTNKQIKAANERMNLEINFNRMNPSAKRRGQMKVKAIIGSIGAAAAFYNTVNSKAGQAAIAAGKSVVAKQAVKRAVRRAAKKAPQQLTLF
jgi:hypothetical protein